MEVHVTPETAKNLNDLATTSRRAPEEIVEDALRRASGLSIGYAVCHAMSAAVPEAAN
jgi:predicted transcriptional regulator